MTNDKKDLKVGLVMPIAPIDGCSAQHWVDVKEIIIESLSSLESYNTDPKIVSEGDSSGLIHKRIVDGLFSSDIIICDVSCKNPNVMFELGMRLAFDKPTVIIKDDQTDYAFDTGVIEHLQYPRDLRYSEIIEFKKKLAVKVKSTVEDAENNPEHSAFLKSFGTYKIAAIEEKEITASDFVIKSIKEIQNDMSELKLLTSHSKYPTAISFKELTTKGDKKQTQRVFDILENHVNKLLDKDLNYIVPLKDLVPVITPHLNKYGHDLNEEAVLELLKNFMEEKSFLYI